MSTLKVPVNSADHVQGPESAAITLVEYGDYECPHCGRAHPIVKRVQEHFSERLRFVFRNFPLNEMHPHAEGAAETAEFAAQHDKFWEMHDLLFENQEQLGNEFFSEVTRELKLPVAAFHQALRDGTFRDRVRGDFTGGVRSGVNGTPTFFINGKRHDGPFDFESLVSALDAVL